MLASDIMNLLHRVLSPQYRYYMIIGLAVVAAIAGIWMYLKKKDDG